MSEVAEEVSEHQPETIAEVKYLATFVRGSFHALRDLTWDQPGRSIVVSETQMFHLEEHAVDFVGTSDGDVLTKDRFEFEPYDGDEPVGFRLPTAEETAKEEATAAAIAKGRRNALAKARVDEEMAQFDRENTQTPRARARAR